MEITKEIAKRILDEFNYFNLRAVEDCENVDGINVERLLDECRFKVEIGFHLYVRFYFVENCGYMELDERLDVIEEYGEWDSVHETFYIDEIKQKASKVPANFDYTNIVPDMLLDVLFDEYVEERTTSLGFIEGVPYQVRYDNRGNVLHVRCLADERKSVKEYLDELVDLTIEVEDDGVWEHLSFYFS